MLECTYNTNSSDGFSPSLRDNFFESPKSGQLFLSPITTVNHNNNVCAVQQMLIYIFSPILWQFLGKIIQQMTGFSDCWLAIYTLFDDWFQTPHVVLQWPIHAFFLISKNADFFLFNFLPFVPTKFKLRIIRRKQLISQRKVESSIHHVETGRQNYYSVISCNYKMVFESKIWKALSICKMTTLDFCLWCLF